MRTTPLRPGQRRAIGRLLRSVDLYVVFAIVGVIAYIIVVNLIAETLAADITLDLEKRLQEVPVNATAPQLPAEVYWPYKWPAQPIAELNVLRDGKAYVLNSLARMAPLLQQLPEAQLAAWDLLLLTGAAPTGVLSTSADELQRVVRRLIGTSAAGGGGAAAPSLDTLRAVRAAVESAAAVWSVKAMASEVAAAETLLREVPLPPVPPSMTAIPATSWAAVSHCVWDAVTPPGLSLSVHVADAYQWVRNASASLWRPTEKAGPMLPLAHQRLLPLHAGSFDSTVPLTRLLLQLWVLGGKSDVVLVAAYDAAVVDIVRTLLHTRTIRASGHEMNFTFVASAAELAVTLATPRTCALAGVLAEGVRHGAHRHAARPPTAGFSEDDVLSAAEALAASCFQQYADPAGSKLRGAVYVTSAGPVAGYALSTPSLRRRSYCDVPSLLVEAFHELYLTTHDAMYGAWALTVMSAGGTADHCGVTARELGTAAPWRRHLRELRGLWLLLHRMDCLLYRRSRGTRGMCELTANTMVSPFTGHLVRLPVPTGNDAR